MTDDRLPSNARERTSGRAGMHVTDGPIVARLSTTYSVRRNISPRLTARWGGFGIELGWTRGRLENVSERIRFPSVRPAYLSPESFSGRDLIVVVPTQIPEPKIDAGRKNARTRKGKIVTADVFRGVLGNESVSRRLRAGRDHREITAVRGVLERFAIPLGNAVSNNCSKIIRFSVSFREHSAGFKSSIETTPWA